MKEDLPTLIKEWNEAFGAGRMEEAKRLSDEMAELAKTLPPDPIHEEIDKLRTHIAKAPKKARQVAFGFLPTDMARISPFFPISKRQMKNREHETLTWESGWGKIEFEGPRLCIYDEDVLLAVLSLVKRHRRLSIVTTRHELVGILRATKGRDTYNAVWQALERLTKSVVKLECWKKEKGRRKKVRFMISNILAGATMDLETGKITLTINPYFYETFTEGLITYLDLDTRRKLKGDITKALYRFLASHRGETFTAHMLTVARAINMDTGQSLFKIRSALRRAIGEMKRIGFLSSGDIGKGDVLTTKQIDSR